MIWYSIVESTSRVFLWALVVAPFHSGDVSSIGRYAVYGTLLVRMRVPMRGLGPMAKPWICEACGSFLNKDPTYIHIYI